MDKIILYMDNIPSARKARRLVLENVGYKVLEAPTIEEAELKLENERVHLCIFDVRMQDENSRHDVSGILLAQKEKYRALPKIILTGYPGYDYVREALGIGPDGIPPAINFLSKREGPDALIKAVDHAFEHHVNINWDLVISWNEQEPLSFHHLARLIESASEDKALLDRREEELEDLFRRLFFKKDQIKIDRKLWHRDGRVALSVFAYAGGKPREAHVVVCGQSERVLAEAQHYHDYAPKAPSGTATMLSRTGETLHYAANCYTPAGAQLESLHSLSHHYHTNSDKLFNNSLKLLFEKTLADWHRHERVLEKGEAIDDLYRERLHLTGDNAAPDRFKKVVRQLVEQLSVIGINMEFSSNRLIIDFGRDTVSYSDPTPILYRRFKLGAQPLLLNTPGLLTGDNILVDTSGGAWLTDFAEAGLAPAFWNFVSLEAAVRFDWTHASKIHWVHEMEKYLISSDFTRLHHSDLEVPLRKSSKSIQLIRQLATQVVGKDVQSYNLGIMFQAVSRITQFNPAHPYKEESLAQFAHALIAAAMIYDKIKPSEPLAAISEESRETGVRMDVAAKVVWVDGVRVPLSGKIYGLLRCLYESPNHSRTRHELFEQVFGETYDEMDKSKASRLNTAIFRLRERIEDDPHEPHYLLTDYKGGYRLVVEGED